MFYTKSQDTILLRICTFNVDCRHRSRRVDDVTEIQRDQKNGQESEKHNDSQYLKTTLSFQKMWDSSEKLNRSQTESIVFEQIKSD